MKQKILFFGMLLSIHLLSAQMKNFQLINSVHHTPISFAIIKDVDSETKTTTDSLGNLLFDQKSTVLVLAVGYELTKIDLGKGNEIILLDPKEIEIPEIIFGKRKNKNSTIIRAC